MNFYLCDRRSRNTKKSLKYFILNYCMYIFKWDYPYSYAVSTRRLSITLKKLYTNEFRKVCSDPIIFSFSRCKNTAEEEKWHSLNWYVQFPDIKLSSVVSFVHCIPFFSRSKLRITVRITGKWACLPTLESRIKCDNDSFYICMINK